jgi:hypothetical protein
LLFNLLSIISIFAADSSQMQFRLENTDKDTHARAGIISTAHGEIRTPVFMPVGTAGTVKAVHQRELKEDVGEHLPSLPPAWH